MTVDEILAELTQLSLEELQSVIERVDELKLEAAKALAAQPLSKARKAKIESMLAKEKQFSDSLDFTTTSEEIDKSKREGRL